MQTRVVGSLRARGGMKSRVRVTPDAPRLREILCIRCGPLHHFLLPREACNCFMRVFFPCPRRRLGELAGRGRELQSSSFVLTSFSEVHGITSSTGPSLQTAYFLRGIDLSLCRTQEAVSSSRSLRPRCWPKFPGRSARERFAMHGPDSDSNKISKNKTRES